MMQLVMTVSSSGQVKCARHDIMIHRLHSLLHSLIYIYILMYESVELYDNCYDTSHQSCHEQVE